MIDLGTFNLHRARLLIDSLKKQGVRYFCVAPGSRSSPIACVIGTLPAEERCVHFDERGLGFHALGFAKASKSPVAILVTSGTAVANLLPAVIEAFLSHVPLIIISADRPPELRDCGANQTIDQVNLFGSFTKLAIDLAFSDACTSDSYLTSSIAYGVYQAVHDSKGPVQINCMIREPLLSKEENKPLATSCHYAKTEIVPSLSALQSWAGLLSSYTKGVIILGSDAIQEEFNSLLILAERLGWPIFSDILSGGRSIGDHPFHVEHPDLILKTFPDKKVDVILHIGSRLTSKTMSQWIKKQTDLAYFLVASHSQRQDPDHLVTHRMQSSTSFFCKNISSLLQKEKDPSWALSWKELAISIKKDLAKFFKSNQDLSEPALIYSLAKSSHLFFSNSMPIRDADLFLFPEKGLPFVHANRGASGIDGNIATAIGLASALKQQTPLIAVLGDLAALHDLNSLALWQKSSTPIFFLIINNQGGGIFSFLPVSEKKEIFEELIATKHSYNFDLIAETFSLPFYPVTSWNQWQSTWSEVNAEQKSCIIECRTDRTENVAHHEKIYEQVKKTLCSPINPLDLEKTLLSASSTAS